MTTMRFKLVSSLALAVMTLCGCGARKQAEIPLSAVAKDIQSRGYRVQKSFVKPPTDWEVSRFGIRNRTMVAFKAEQPMPNERDAYYCRFSLSEEAYDSNADARQRLAHLHDDVPGASVEEEYVRVLSEGFVVGSTLYVLQTDVSKFHPEIQQLTKALAASHTGSG